MTTQDRRNREEKISMAYMLEQFCADSREIIKKQPGDEGREIVRQKLEQLLADKDFIAAYCAPDKPKGTTLLYKDPELDFRVLCHRFNGGSKSPPHNHGSSWAIYGQAGGETDVIVWRRRAYDAKSGHAELEVEQEYKLPTGKAGLFNPGVIHSINFTDGSRYIRVTGTDLNQLNQDVYDLEKQVVFHGNPGAVVDAGSDRREAELSGAKA
jgi:predicted metal-dependent enzyme (double-stranded beta helix superfamily)